MHRPPTPKKILIQRADRLGDMVLALPVIEALKQKFPDCQIDMICSPTGSSLSNLHPQITHTWVYDGHNYWQLLTHIRRAEYDTYISLWAIPKWAYLGKLAGIPTRIGDASNPGLRWLFTHTVFQRWADQTRHQLEFNLELLTPFGIENPEPVTRLYPEARTQAAMSVKFPILDPAKRQPGEKTVMLFCDSGGSNATIPTEAVTAFLTQHAQSKLQFILSFGKTAPDVLPIIIQQPNVTIITEALQLSEFIGVLSLCDFYIGPDTGPTHLAAFLNKPIVFFSARKCNLPTRWGPYSEFVQIIRKDYLCPHKPSDVCTLPTCPSAISGSQLAQSFKALQQDVAANQRLKPAKRKVLFNLNAFRIAYFVKSLDDFAMAEPVLQHFRQKGLLVFPFHFNRRRPLKSLRLLFKFMKEKNITILQGNAIPKWVIWWVRFVIGTLYAYIRPIYVKDPFIKSFEIPHYLDLYNETWKANH